MKIIHCADIHLDSKMTAHFTPSIAKERQNELLASFGKMIDYANTKEVSIIIIAGDLMDTDTENMRACDYVLSTIRANPHIKFLYLVGNHDSNTALLKMDNLPNNLFTFGKEWKTYNFDNVDITGIENLTKISQYNQLNLDKNKLNIVVLHGQEIKGQKTDGDVINLNELKNKNIDYLALGHIHTYKQSKLDDRGIYCYSGCLEGRGFDECGKKGFVLLNVSDKIESSFIPFSNRELKEIEIDITNLINYHEIKQKILESIKNESQKNIIRIKLIGSYQLETEKYIDTLAKDFKDKFYFFEIVDQSTLFIPEKNFENDISLAGEFIRLVNASDLNDEEKEKTLIYGLQAIKGKDIE